MEQHDNLISDFLENTKGHAAARSGSVRVGSVKPSLCLKLLGISLVAQQFTTVSAESICHAFQSVRKSFDMIGLISALGTAAATKSLLYSALNDSEFYLTGHIGPGSMNLAAVLFEATEIRLARLLAFGGAGDGSNPFRLDCPGGLRYIGLLSYTDCPVGNVVGASIVREFETLWKENQRKGQNGRSGLLKGRSEDEDVEVQGRPKFGRLVGRDAKRKVKVITLTVGKTDENQDEIIRVSLKAGKRGVLSTGWLPLLQRAVKGIILKVGRMWKTDETQDEIIRVSLKASEGGALLMGWLPLLLTVVVIASCCKCKQWFVAGLILWGTLAVMIAVMGLRLCVFKYSTAQVAEDSPKGDCLVVDDMNFDILHIIQGEERSIQALFQRKIDYTPSSGKYLLLLAGSMLYIYVVASVLYMSNVSTSGQIHFAIANLIGLVADMVKASHNGMLGLAKKAHEKFKIEAEDLIVFRNRTAAVAYVAKHAKDRGMLKSKKLLNCDGPVWQKWWEALAAAKRVGDDEVQVTSNHSITAPADPDGQKLLNTLLQDMKDGLKE